MSDLKAKDSNLLSMSYNTYYTNGSENNWESNIYGYHNSRMKGWIQEQDYYLKKSFDKWVDILLLFLILTGFKMYDISIDILDAN